MLGLGRKVREAEEELFNYLLEEEVRLHLEAAERLAEIPEDEMTQDQQLILNLLKQIYHPQKGCPIGVYDSVPTEMRREYNILHRRITELLY